MNLIEPGALAVVARGGLFVLIVAMAVALYRIVRGPRHADRIVALDLLSILVLAWVALYAVFADEAAFLDVVIAYALIAFLGTVAFARYLERSQAIQRKDCCVDPAGGSHE